jgi:hypothetical protein
VRIIRAAGRRIGETMQHIAFVEVPPTSLCRATVTTCAPFKGKPRPVQLFRVTMPIAKVHASTILVEFGQAQTELVGKAVILTDGKAGTVESVWLDEMHGLRVSIRGHDGKWPVSTIKFAQMG